MAGELYRVNSDQTLKFFIEHARKLFEQEKYVTFKWLIGKERSLNSNALFHLWATEYAAHLLNISKKSVTPGILDGMKRHIKKEFYNETKHDWLVYEVINPKTGERKLDFTSSKTYKSVGMFEFLTYIEAMAVNDGLILEVKGEHKKLQKEYKAA